MASKEQRDYFDILKRYERKFELREINDYKMLLKRHKDDEDLDRLSMERLRLMHQKYHLNREKKSTDQFFNNSDKNDRPE